MIIKRGQGEKELKYIKEELEVIYNYKEKEINYRNTVFKEKKLMENQKIIQEEKKEQEIFKKEKILKEYK